MAVEIEKVIGIHNLPRGQYSPDAWVAIDNGTGNKRILASEIPGGSSSDVAYMVVTATKSGSSYTLNHNFNELSGMLDRGYGVALRVATDSGAWRYYDLCDYVEGQCLVFRTLSDITEVDGDTTMVYTSKATITSSNSFSIELEEKVELAIF